MKVAIQVSVKDSVRAWTLLVRHSPGIALSNRTFIVSEEAVRALQKEQIRFVKLSRETIPAGASGGERTQQEEILIVEKDAEIL